LVETTNKYGVGVLSITNTHHFAALWHETEALAENNLIGIACTAYMPSVAPTGAIKPLFGTNPISFAWPRKNKISCKPQAASDQEKYETIYNRS